jgi:hypothetical protein
MLGTTGHFFAALNLRQKDKLPYVLEHWDNLAKLDQII